MAEPWKRLSSGKYTLLNSLTEDDLDINDIDTSLNFIYRFTGHHKDEIPLTVAQHSLMCYDLAWEFEPTNYEMQLAVLIHDFAEELIGDQASPVKWVLGDAWRSFAMPIEKLFEKKFFGRHVDPELKESVKLYDLASLDIERRMLWKNRMGKDKWPPTYLNLTQEEKELFFHNAKSYKLGDLKNTWEELYNRVRG